VLRLTRVFRQAADSGVVTDAHRINASGPPLLAGMTPAG
jgi:exodeoxyribonuclease V alpha subunit